MDATLAVQLPGLALKNPIMPSSGAFYYGLDHLDDFDLNKLGALVLKTTTVEARQGNPAPTILTVEGDSVFNSVGLANPGVINVVNEFMPALASALPDLPQMISIAGTTVAEYQSLAAAFDKVPNISAIEVNLSCPNVEHGGLEFGTEPSQVTAVLSAIRGVTDKAIYAKLTPNVTAIAPIAQAAQAAGADGIVLINTVKGLAIDRDSRRPLLYRGIGGLSGAAMKPIALRFTYEASQAVNIPVIGVGGIENVDDVIDFLICGASAIQVGRMNHVKPKIMEELVDELPAALKRYGFASVQAATGSLEWNF